MPKDLGAEPNRRRKELVVIARPYCSPDPAESKYEQYCRQSLMQHKAFRQVNELLAVHMQKHTQSSCRLDAFHLPLKKTSSDSNNIKPQQMQHKMR